MYKSNSWQKSHILIRNLLHMLTTPGLFPSFHEQVWDTNLTILIVNLTKVVNYHIVIFFYQLKCHWQRGSDAKKSHTTYYLVAWCCVGRRWPLYGRQLCHIVTYSNCSVLWLIVTWGKGRVVRATLAPSARRCSATARPIPWADPVIITTAPWVTIIIIGQWYDYHWRLK